MELIKFNFEIKTNSGEPRNQREFFIEKIRKMLGNKMKREKNGEIKDLGRQWTYRELGIYLGGIPTEWLRQYYTASVDAQVPARHFCWLIKETRKPNLNK